MGGAGRVQAVSRQAGSGGAHARGQAGGTGGLLRAGGSHHTTPFAAETKAPPLPLARVNVIHFHPPTIFPLTPSVSPPALHPPSPPAPPCSKTTKYWVRDDDVMALKARLVRHLPLLIYGRPAAAAGAAGGAQRQALSFLEVRGLLGAGRSGADGGRGSRAGRRAANAGWQRKRCASQAPPPAAHQLAQR